MTLFEVEVEEDAAGGLDGFLRDEHGLAGRVATAGSGVDAPGGVALAVDGVGDGAVGALAVRAVVEL